MVLPLKLETLFNRRFIKIVEVEMERRLAKDFEKLRRWNLDEVLKNGANDTYLFMSLGRDYKWKPKCHIPQYIKVNKLYSQIVI